MNLLFNQQYSERAIYPLSISNKLQNKINMTITHFFKITSEILNIKRKYF